MNIVKIIQIIACCLFFLGCVSHPNRPRPVAVTQPHDLKDQLAHLRRALELGEIEAFPKKLIAESFLRLTQEEQARYHLNLLDLRSPASLGCNLADMATADANTDNLNILMAGDSFIPWKKEEKIWSYVRKVYGIRYLHFGHGGTEPHQFYHLIKTYNAVAEQNILKKFRKSHIDIWEEAKRKMGVQR